MEHHGILGQRWGKRNGPPYPLDSSVSTGSRLKEAAARAVKGATAGPFGRAGNVSTRNSIDEIEARARANKAKIEAIRKYNEEHKKDAEKRKASKAAKEKEKYDSMTDLQKKEYDARKQAKQIAREGVGASNKYIVKDTVKSSAKAALASAGAAAVMGVIIGKVGGLDNKETAKISMEMAAKSAAISALLTGALTSVGDVSMRKAAEDEYVKIIRRNDYKKTNPEYYDDADDGTGLRTLKSIY